MQEMIQQNLANIHQRIEKACIACGRKTSEIQLLMATKTVAPINILHAFSHGELLIGENKLQELTEKYKALSVIPHTTHFIGHLQSNKVKNVINYVDCIQSVDRLSLAEILEKQLAKTNKTMPILIQINSSAEASKFGCSPEETISLVEKIATFPHLQIKGLMTIGLFSTEQDKIRKCFQLVQNIKKQILARNIPKVTMDIISMGMSNDLEIAIEEGATIIRVGTAIFGERLYPDSYYWNENKS